MSRSPRRKAIKYSRWIAKKSNYRMTGEEYCIRFARRGFRLTSGWACSRYANIHYYGRRIPYFDEYLILTLSNLHEKTIKLRSNEKKI